MKCLVLFILVTVIIMGFAKDGCLDKAKFNLPDPSISDTCAGHPDLDQADFRGELASTDLPRKAQPGTLRVSPTLQIIHRYHPNSSGGIPL